MSTIRVGLWSGSRRTGACGSRRWSQPVIRCMPSTRWRCRATAIATTWAAPSPTLVTPRWLADLVRTDRHNHRPIAGDSPQAEAIKVLARGHQHLIWARPRHTNQPRSALGEYYPAALEAFSDLADRDTL